MRAAIGLLATVVILGCLAVTGPGGANAPEPAEVSPPALALVESSSVAVLAYFKAPAGTAAKIVSRLKEAEAKKGGLRYFVAEQGEESAYICFIGSGTLLKDDHVLSVSHLFYDNAPELTGQTPVIWVLVKGLAQPIGADVVAVSPRVPESEIAVDDYAVLKLRTPLGRPGVRLASRPAPLGGPVLFCGNVKGTAFLLRRCYSTEVNQFFIRRADGKLHLTYLIDSEPLLTVFPAGPGDSGGGIFNARGELVGVMYCGLSIADTMYVFSNPITKAREFLEKFGLGALAGGD